MSYGSQPAADPWDWGLGDEGNGSSNNGGIHHVQQVQQTQGVQQLNKPFGGPNDSWAPPANGSIPQVLRQQQQYPRMYNDSKSFTMAGSQNAADFFDTIIPSEKNESSQWGQQTPMWAPHNPTHTIPVISNHYSAGQQIEAENNEIAPPDVEYRTSISPGYTNVLSEKNANISAEESRNVNNNRVSQVERPPSQNHSAHVKSEVNYPNINQRWSEPEVNHPNSQPLLQTVNIRSLVQNSNDAVRQSNVSFANPPTRVPPTLLASSAFSNPSDDFNSIPMNMESTEPTTCKLQPVPTDHPSKTSQHQRQHSIDNNASVFNPSFTQTISSSNSVQQQPSDFKPFEFQNAISSSQTFAFQPSQIDSPLKITQPITSDRASSDQELRNQGMPSLQDMNSEIRNLPPVSTNAGNIPTVANSSKIFSTPETKKNTNPFLTTMSTISVDTGMGIQPLGASTPTGMPFKPENEEVPSQQENLEHHMMNLNIEKEHPKRESQYQEPPVAQKEVLLVSDRNQYLETGQLSASKENEESSVLDLADEAEGDTAPPPGLDRMVTGQLREPIATPSIDDIQSMNSNAPTVGSCHLGESSTSSVVSEGDGRKSGSVEGVEDEPESQRLVQGESTAEDQPASIYLAGPPGLREVPGEAEPVRGRVVVGQMGRGSTPPTLQDQPSPRNDRERGEREIVGRMVVGERTELLTQPNSQDDYRHRPRHRHPRGESSYEEEDRDYSSDRDRRDRERGDFKRDDRTRRRRDDRHRSPDYRSDEEYDDKRPYPPRTRERDRRERRERDRDYSPDRDYYYRDYYHDPRDRRPRRFDRERDYHHHRDFDDDYYNFRDHHRSRPSSRTGSDYRRLNVSADYANRSRHYYPDSSKNVSNPLKSVVKSHSTSMLLNSSIASTGSGFPDFSKVDPREYSEYLETMRRVDPAGYAVWYNNYMAARYGLRQSTTNFTNDRASVHSGQSSSNQRQAAQSPSAIADEEKEEDYTPRLYTTAHVRGKIDNYGRLLVVEPHYPMDGQRASISLYQLNSLPVPDADMEEFLETPGPFIPGITHRSTVLSYLKRMSEASQKNSEKLLYDLIHLIVKGNGEINGCDVSELLMNSFKKCTYDEDRRESDGDGAISRSEVVTRFRELLIQGNQLEALEWAIEKGAWGHALFLSSKMDPKTHKDVMFRFVDSISQNDPIRTLYQMMSGHIPQASECCGDKKWSDWRPHLAMILGNPTANSRIDRKSIIRLGDSLSAKGRIFAAHFCYVVAHVEVVAYKPSAKLILLGANAKLDNPLLASCRSIMLTMCFEYGLKLKQPDFSIPSLQMYKLILTTRLIDISRNKLALQYCQMMALEALQCGNYDRSMMTHVVDIASRLKMVEPSLALSGDVNDEPEWLEKLKNHFYSLPDDYESRVELRPSASSSTISEVGQEVQAEAPLLGNQARNPINTITQPLYDPYVAYNPELTVTSDLPPKNFVPQQPLLVSDIQDYNSGSVINPPPVVPNPYLEMPPPAVTSTNSNYGQEPASYWDNNPGGSVTFDNNATNNIGNSYDYGGNLEAPSTPVKTNDFFKVTEEQLKEADDESPSLKALNDVANSSSRDAETKNPSNQQVTTEGQSNQGKPDDQKSGWFGGILDKLSMRPKNQMKLPDDKNPSIVWDKEKKRWVNLEGDKDTTNQIKPPPRTFELGGAVQPIPAPDASIAPGQNVGPSSLPPPSNNNKYKLPKRKLMKNNYVDIMGSKSNVSQSQPHSLDGYVPLLPPAAAQPILFTPSSVEGQENAPYDFITPSSNPRLPQGQNGGDDNSTNQPQLSRCSSVSSLSREVQFYMDNQSMRGNSCNAAPPMMYNPSQMQ